MASSLTVKAFLQREGTLEAEPEIRRFPVEASSGSDTYRALVDKVAAVFPGLKPGSFTLHWKDEDDDLVQFSTQAELLHANQFSDGIFKIYVFASAAETDTDEETDNATGEREVAEDGTACHVLHPNPMMSRRWGGGPWGSGMRRLGKTAKLLGMKKKCLKKMMKAEKGKCKMFHALASQVPQAFRQWVRMYVKNWFFKGQSDATVMAPGSEQLPEGAPPNFRQWLSDFLANYKDQKLSETVTKGIDAEEMEVLENDEQEKEGSFMLPPPEGLPPVYYQWICSFLPRFVSNHDLDGSDKNPMFPGQHGGPFHGHGHHGHHHWKHGGHGHHKHGCRKGKGGKHGEHSSSDSEDNGCPHEQLWTKVPKEFRTYVRKMIKHLHKNKADKPGHSEKLIAPAGMSPEVTQFLQQYVQDWHAKLTEKRPHAVSMEMMDGEGTALPQGLERDHFHWLCRFMARWHRRHAGKCDIMGNWSSGDTSDDTSGDEGKDDFGAYGGYGGWPHCRKRHFHAAMMEHHGFPGRGHPFHPGHGHPFHPGHGHPFHPGHGHPFHPGRGHPFHPVHTPPFLPMGFMGEEPDFAHGCQAMGSYGFGMMAAPPMQIGCPGRGGCFIGKDQDAKRRKNQTGAATCPSHSATAAPEAEPIDRVTEGVRKM